MWNDDDRKWLYEQMKNAGVDTGTYDEFKQSLNNEEDRDWYYKKSRSMGLDVGSAADFAGMMVEPVVSSPAQQQSTGANPVARPVVGQQQGGAASVRQQSGHSEGGGVQPTIPVTPRMSQEELEAQWAQLSPEARRVIFGDEAYKHNGGLYDGTEIPGIRASTPDWDREHPEEAERMKRRDDAIDNEKRMAFLATPLGQQAKAKEEEYLKRNELLQAQRELERLEREQEAYDRQRIGRLASQSVNGGHVDSRDLPAMHADDAHLAQLHQAQERVHVLEESLNKDTSGFWRNLWHTVSNPQTWSFGLSPLNDALAMSRTADKLNEGAGLTGEEQGLLEQYVLTQDAKERYGDDMGFMARAGNITGEALPFVAEFLVTGGFSGAADATATAATNAIARATATNLANKGLRSWLVKSTGTLTGDVVGATLMANTTGAAKTAADVLQRHTGDTVIQDENGEYHIGHYEDDGEGGSRFVDGGKTWAQSIWEAEAANTLEYYTEMLGAHLEGPMGRLGSWLAQKTGFSKAGAYVASKLGLAEVSKDLSQITANGYGRALKHALERGGIQDYPSEVLEEEANIVLNSILVGDNSLSDLIDGRTQADIWGGMLFSVGFMQSPSFVGGTVDAANYLRTKHRLDNADRVASYRMSDERWSPLRDRIDGTDNEGFAALATEILNDGDMHAEEKRAALQYMGELAKFRGFNIGASAKAKDEAEAANPAADAAGTVATGTTETAGNLNLSYIGGYNVADGQQQNDIKNGYDFQRQRFADLASDDVVSQFDADPVGTLQGILSNDMWTEDEKQVAVDYANAKMAYDGMVQRVRDDIDSRIAVSNAAVDSRTHHEDGMIHPATLTTDRKVYIVGGSVVMHDDGSGIDREASRASNGGDGMVLVADAESGKIEAVSVEEFLSADEAVDAAQEKAEAQEAIRQQYAQEAANRIDGVLPFNEGDQYAVMDEQGQEHTVMVVPVPVGETDGREPVQVGEGEVLVSVDGGEAVVMPREQVQVMADNANLARMQQYEQERAAALSQQREQEREASRPVYGLNDEVTLQTGEGTVRGSITAEANEDGLIEVYTERPVGGKKIHLYNRDELDGMVVEHNGAAQAPTADAAGTAAAQAESGLDNAGGEAGGENATGANNPPAAAPSAPAADAAGTTAEPMPMVGEGEDAEPDFTKASPERAHSFIYNEAGLSRDEANQFVDANKKDADKTLQKMQEKKPKMGTSLAKYRKEMNEWQARVEAARHRADYWQQVKDAQQKVVLAEREAMAAQQSAQTQQAIVEEQARQADELRKREEQARLGSNNVAPQITERWNSAPKVDGARNEIVLANGEKVAGHYVLVESGAATPSHNANAEFVRNDGFPVDDNGQTVNDRDYERDQDAQTTTRQIANAYDQRALQTPVVVSSDGIVLSGNGRTMAGELAAQQGTDAAYIEHLKQYGQQFGFTPEQVEGMQHPRVVFVPDEAMPYTAETFAKFNQQEMKGQSKTEQAVKFGKIVDDETFGRVIRSINAFDTLGDFYADPQAATQAINELLSSGAISRAQYAEMFDGDAISAQGKEILENMLIGKAFESNPDAVREITSVKSMRQSIICALAEISNNLMLGKDFSLESELAQAIELVYKARKEGYKTGERVSGYARQLNLFAFDDGASVADYTNATVLMLADVINDNRVTRLKKWLTLYNHAAQESANGQMDLFTGGVKSQQEIINEVKQLLNNGTDEEQQAALDNAVEQRTAAAEQSSGAEPGTKQDDAGSDGDEGHDVAPETPAAEPQDAVDAAVASAEAETNTSPTDGQKEAGNYKKGHVKIDGFDISIENPKGSTRSGRDDSGKEWSVTMRNTYGYMRGTEGVDGDHIDVFLSDHLEDWNGTVWVVDQVDRFGFFDEHKVMYGFNSEEEARAAYLSNYSEGWQGLGGITGVTKEEFKKWIESSHRKTKPFAEYRRIQEVAVAEAAAMPQHSEQEATMSDEEVSALIDSMKSHAVVAPEVEITDANWRESVSTPIGEVKMGANQREKLFAKGREQQYGMLLETLGNPDLVLEERDKEENMFHERPSSFLFIKTFQKPDGSKYVHFESVTVSQDGMEISVSSHIIRENQLRNKVKSDRLLYKATALDEPAHSPAEQPTNEGSSLSSGDKGNKKSPSDQGNVIKNERRGENTTPEQQALLNGNNPHQYPDGREQGKTLPPSETPGQSDVEAGAVTSNLSAGKDTNNSDNEQEKSEKSAEKVTSYSVSPKEYVTKKGKKLDMQLVKFDAELSKEQQRAANNLAKQLKGWWSKEDGGFLMRDAESAEQLASAVLEESGEALEDAAPASLSDMRMVTDVAQQEAAAQQPTEEPAADAAGTVAAPADDTARSRDNGRNERTEDSSYGANNSLVSRDRYEELKQRMRKKMLGQLNMGIDPEILTIGIEMATYHIEAGARKFADFAKKMIEDLGDAIRPYLKSFYNGARELPEVEDAGYSADMTPYDEVKRFDVLSIGGETAERSAPTVFEQADEIVKEQDAERQAKEATEKILEIAKKGKKTEQKRGKSGESKKNSVSLQQEGDLFGSFGDDATHVEPQNDNSNGHARTDAVRSEGLPADDNQQGEHTERRSQTSGQEGGRADREREESGVRVSQRPAGRLQGLENTLGVSNGDTRGSVRPLGSDNRRDESERGRNDVPLSPVTNPKNTRNNHAERGKDYAPIAVDARIDANIKAIELMKQLMESGEQATAEQMAVLRQFSGWGGLGKAFENFTVHRNGKPQPQYLRELLGEEAYEQANMSRNSAYYTPAGVIDALWDIARAMGFKGGRVLEGSAGIGNILGLMPTDLSERSDIQAVEIDQTTGNILRLLYPDAQVDVQGFEATQVENGSVDLAITNVPFVTGLRVNDTTGDKDLSKKFHDIHDFCIAKNVRKLRDGGIGIFITSSGTLDNSARLREWIVQEGGADVVGAFRLNNETFGGTGATSDIIVIRKRVNGKKSPYAIDVLSTTGERIAEYDTGETKKVKGEEIPIIKQLSMDYNSYFVEHPEMMAGEMHFGFEKGDTFRPTSKALYPAKGKNQGDMLKSWASSFGEKDWEALPEADASGTVADVYEELGAGVKEGSMVVDQHGTLCIAQRGKAVPLAVNANKVKGHSKAECFKSYKRIKDALGELLEYQSEHEDDAGLPPLLKALNKAYDDFVKTYGHLHKNTSISFLKNDVDFANILALEKYSERGDVNTGKRIQEYGKTDIFRQRVVEREKVPEAKNVKDGIIASIYVHGRVDVPWIAEQLNRHDGETAMHTEEQVKQEIIASGLGFENPVTRQMEVSYEYLSGNVREKLAQAQANNGDGQYDANIKALEKVIPDNIPAHLIDFSIGSSWIDPKLYEEYVKDKTDIGVTFTAAGGTWFMSDPGYVGEQKNIAMGVKSELLHRTYYGTQLIEAAMQNKTITASETRKKWDGSTETITDKEATQAIASKIDEIRQDFKEWARAKMQSDAALSERIERIYNDMFNNYVPKSIPADFVTEHFGGASTSVTLRPHQGRAVVRGTTQPLLLAHEVGSGKTYTLISIAMEMRRLGTARKPMIVVQNATVGQFVESAKELYPGAKVLTIEEADRTAEGRKNFYAKIKYNDWDMIVVPQSVFERIPDSEERQMKFVQDKIEEKMLVLEQMKDADPQGNSSITRQAEKEIEKLEEELAGLTNAISSKRKERDEKRAAITRQNAEVKALEMLDRQTDDVENFDDMGIDAILVDEAHEYKHLGFATAMQRGVKGVDPSYSKKAQGVYLKTQAVLEKNNGRNVIFATGTPISNTAAEIWTFMRYLMPADTMKEYGIYYFDDFVRNFGNLQQMLEFTTSGKFKENNRFAGYVNLPELVRIWSSVADTVLLDEIEEDRRKQGKEDLRPQLESGKAIDIYLPQTRALRSVMKYVKAKLKEYDEMSGKEKKENSHIPLTMYGIAKAAAVDARLVVSDAADEPQSKTNEAVRQTLRSLRETDSYKGTVALFADSYQNKKSGFNLYEDIREKLIAQGVPAEQIVVMKSGMSVKKKLEIFDKVNRGEVRVIMGSTFTLGTGVNIQERLHTLIHLDAPNRPMDYTQRNGRILRQGNLHKEMGKPVRVLRFGVEDSLDVTAYQRLKTKGAIADSIMNGKKMMANSMENRALEEEEDVFGDTVAQLSGSEYAMLKNQAEKDVRKYEAKKKQWQADQTYCHNEIPRLENDIKMWKGWLEKYQRNLALVEGVNAPVAEAPGTVAFPGGKTAVHTITVGKQTFPSVEAMADFIKEYNKSIKETENELRDNPSVHSQTRRLTVNVGGLEFVFTTEQNVEAYEDNQGTLFSAVRRKMTYSCEALGLEDVPVHQSLLREGLEDIVKNVVSGQDFREGIERCERNIAKSEKTLAQVRERHGKPFEFEKELEQAHERLDEYSELMKKELEEKEKKYAEMDADVDAASDISEAEEADEEEDTDDEGMRFRDGEEEGEEDDGVRFREVSDVDTIDMLENQPTVKVYRSMVLIDGKLYPPMSSKEAEGKQLRQPSELGKWEESEEAPEKAVMRNGKWYFPLRKDNGKMLYAAYNPYIHTSTTMLNDQFSEAQDRSNLVVVEMEVPVSELSGDYQAEKAKDSVGVKQWKAGVIQGQLSGTREVILTRWAKPVRVVPVDEVADHISNMLAGQIETMPTNVVTPQVREALEARGMKFVKTNNQGKLVEGENAGRTWASVYGKKRESTREREGSAPASETYEERLAAARRVGYSKKQYDGYRERIWRQMHERADEVIQRLGLGGRVTIMDTPEGLKGRKARAKGWFDAKTGKIVIIMSNHGSVTDVVKTILHEGVAHYGLRKLFGKHFDQFLDNVYQHADDAVRSAIAELAKKHGWDFREATEEYLARLAEDTNFDRANGSVWWSKIKSLFLDMWHQIVGDYSGASLSDNELRYILWRSYENLAEPGLYRNPFAEAKDISKQMELGVLSGMKATRGRAGSFDRERVRIHSLGRIDTSRLVAAEAIDYPVGRTGGHNVHFRDGDFSERDRVIARHAYERMVSSGTYQFREAVQDSMLGLKKLYDAILNPSGKPKGTVRIEDVDGYENAYLAENRMSSMNAAEQHDYYVHFMRPLLEAIGKLTHPAGKTSGHSKGAREALVEYMMAKHGLERNQVFAARDFALYQQEHPYGQKTLADFRERDYSGLTALTGEDDVAAAEAAAQQIVDSYEGAYDTADLWDRTREATQATLEKIYRSGLLSKERYEKIRDMFEYYIPLQGWDETTSDEVYGYLTSKNGPLGGSPIKHAVGRSSKADDPIATIAMMADDAIRLGNRNVMKQRFLNFVLNHPSDLVSVNDLWLQYDAASDEWIPVFADIEDGDSADDVARKVEAFEERMEQLAESDPDHYKRGRDAENIPYKVVKGNLKEHQVLVRRGGRTYVLTVNGNPRAAQALNGLTNPDVEQGGIVGNMLKLGEYVNRNLSAFYTTRNPDFVVSNFLRDMLYSNCMSWVKESPSYALKFHKNFGKFNPATMRYLLGKWEHGTLDMNSRMEHLFYQFMLNGGETGYTNIKDIEGHKKEVVKELKKQGSAGRRALSVLGLQLDLLNRSVENCARFAAFVTSREMGRSIERSIYDAKEVSVNFNKKGSGGKMVNATGQTFLGKVGSYVGGGGRLLYVFWNAGVQGLTNFGRAGKLHKGKALAGAATMFMLGYIVPQLASLMGGGDGDDDDKNSYYNQPEYVRRSNILLCIGDEYLSIPLPIEFRALYGLGELASGVISGNEYYDNKELTFQALSQVSQILPLDMLEGGGGVSPFIPSSAKPFVEAYMMNRSWTGLPIYKDTPWNKDDPEWTKVYKNADQTLVGVSRWLNEATGGDDFRKGWLDINPAKLEYLLNGVFGGYTNTAGKLKKMGETAFGDREFEWRNMLLANRVVKSGDERTANRKLQNEYFKYKKEYDETGRLIRKYENAAEDGVIGMAEKADFMYNSPAYLRYELFDEYKADIDDMREDMKEASDDAERKAIEAEMYATMRELIDQLHEIK